ncbi:MAG TPA: glycine cleavage system protein GcvH [Pirellulales bacterium]|nr:glycine cleavage system protein GcvH [Pirellulales bacterium]
MKPENLLFSKSHEWVHIEPDASGGKVATVGISAFALEALTDLVHIELPKVGRTLKTGESFGEIESVKAVSDLYSPVDGTVVAVHDSLPGELDSLPSDPYGQGWIAKIKITDETSLGELMDYNAYQKQCAEEGH